MLTGVERSRAPFQDILCEGSDRGIIQGSNAIFEWFPVLPVTFKCDDQLGVSEHRHVGVVGTGDHLSNTLELAQVCHNAVIDESIVQIVLWLINNQRGSRGPEQE